MTRLAHAVVRAFTVPLILVAVSTLCTLVRGYPQQAPVKPNMRPPAVPKQAPAPAKGQDAAPAQPDVRERPLVGSNGQPIQVSGPKAAGPGAQGQAPEEKPVVPLAERDRNKIKPPEPMLPLFGYSFFDRVRQIIDARRMALRGLYAPRPSDKPGSNPADQTSGAVTTPPFPGDREAPVKPGGADEPDTGGVVPPNPPGELQTGPTTGGTGTPATGPVPPVTNQGDQSPATPQIPRGDQSQPALPQTGQAYQTPPPPAIDALRYVVTPDMMLSQNIQIPAPERYLLGPGDTLDLRYWSPTLEATDVALTVDSRGYVSLPLGDRLIVRGLTVGQAEELIRRRLAPKLVGVRVSLTLQALRTIGILIMGESYAPGAYQMPSTVTLFNALYASGGPTDHGSLRRIILKRNDKSRVFDFYKLLVDGDSSQDVPLQPGDVVFIPPVEARVSVKGEVFTPAQFELAGNETLKDALHFAGGAKPSGITQSVSVESVVPGQDRRIKDVDLTSAKPNSNPVLYDGDIVEVRSIRPEIKNLVTIDGAVDQPGRYGLTDGLTVADLVGRARGTRDDVYMPRADLFRMNPDNTIRLIPIDLLKALQKDPKENAKLEPRDRLVIYSIEDVRFTGYRTVDIAGAVQKPGSFYRADGMRVQDLLLQAGGTKPDAFMDYAFLQRKNDDGSLGPLLKVDLGKALAGDPSSNYVLSDRDTLTVYTADQARFRPEQIVSVQGAVQNPGSFPRGANMHLQDALQLAGGLLPDVGDRLYIAHARTDIDEPPVMVQVSPTDGRPMSNPAIADGDVVIVKSRSDYQDKPRVVTVMGAVKRPGPVVLTGREVRLSEAIKEAGGLLPEAYPAGTTFTRNPELLANDGQRTIAAAVSKLNDVLSNAEYERELAKSDLDRLKAVSQAVGSPAGGQAIAVPGVTAAPAAPPGQGAAQAEAQATGKLLQSNLVSSARVLSDAELQPAGNVAIDLAAALKAPGKNDSDILLLPDDTIYVPERPSTVMIVGAVEHPRSVIFRPGANVSYYVENAGGYTMDARKDRMVVVRPGLGLRPANKVGSLEAGDMILVPTAVMAANLHSRSADIDQVFKGLTTSTLIVLAVKKLLGL